MMKKFAGGWICLLLTCVATTAMASGLVTELEKLRDGLTPRDPARPALTLRLADVMFDEAVKAERKDDHSGILPATRRRSLALYQEALTGNGGMFPAIQGSLRTKIIFQQARLRVELGETAEAAKLWQEVLTQDAIPELKREAALRLAEASEASTEPGAAKKAEALYQIALGLCQGGDLCSYVHYRRAWLMRRDAREADSLAEIKLALRDSKGQIREEALRDWIVFHGESRTDGIQALSEVDELATKINRPSLLSDLAEAFYSNGNKTAGMRVLELVNARIPTLAQQIRLLEDYYGIRNWDRYRVMLSGIAPNAAAVAETESEKVMRRLIVQLDGERLTRAETIPDFQNTIELYLALFPASVERDKMIEGWLAAEKDDHRKVDRLVGWITEQPGSRKLREMRAAAAQRVGNQAVVAAEMAALAALPGIEPAKVREYHYLQARALYETKDYSAALPLFEELAALGGAKPDQWALQSQHLALDILAQKKDLAGVRRRAEDWATHAPLTDTQRGEFAKIGHEAAFEMAALQGQTPAALVEFKALCLANTLRPKSCDNARILAVRLQQESDLLDILRASGTPAEVAAELEAAGYFADAAAAIEKLPTRVGQHDRASLPVRLKVAILYELGGRTADRDRVLRQVVATTKAKLAEPEEKLFLRTLIDAGMLTVASLNGPWSDGAREQIAHELELHSRGNAHTRAMVLKSKNNLGAAWSRIVMEELGKLNAHQQAISFSGRNSKVRFELRLKALRALVNESERVLPLADNEFRGQAWRMLATANTELADQIQKSPLPEGLSPEALEQVQSAIQQMAQPFTEKAAAYTQLVAGLPVATTDRVAASQAAPSFEAPGGTGIKESPAASNALEVLHRNPLDVNALQALQKHFEGRQAWRLAAYFEGRFQASAKNGAQGAAKP